MDKGDNSINVNTKPVWFNQPTIRVQPREVFVRDQSQEGIDRALSQMKKVMDKENVLQETMDRQYFKSKSRKLYLKRQQLIYKQQLKKEKYEKMPKHMRRGDSGK